MKDDQIKKWESTREKGLLHFVLIRGVLLWGLPMFIFMAFIGKPFSNGFTSSTALVHYVVWPVAGVLFGLLTWCMSERMYKKKKTNSQNT